MRFLGTITNNILNVIFPAKCVLCGKTGTDLCLECLTSSPPAERENLEWISSLYDYRNPNIKKVLWLFKYKNKKRLAPIFAEVMYEKILEELADLSVLQNFRDILLIPIPLSPKRFHDRGYNQAQLICQELTKINKSRDNFKMQLENNILIKPTETEHQARIKNRSARLKNVVGSFDVKNTEKNLGEIKNRNIILIDDITTTGATLSEARKTLKRAGARKIIAFTVAH